MYMNIVVLVEGGESEKTSKFAPYLTLNRSEARLPMGYSFFGQ